VISPSIVISVEGMENLSLNATARFLVKIPSFFAPTNRLSLDLFSRKYPITLTIGSRTRQSPFLGGARSRDCHSIATEILQVRISFTVG
jgi:hypothetical protein